ncbi:hypothetical protein FA10DRAFT_19698 [Acaromyces ingoldii]|uniref:Uncharacterized protein n=1 Tax=Acaromyces ingoldii TaxID=215250 RepID=A0A316YZ83_9BASI|nr:hypothetical protein FA10DRAFT_19698 [Acaromyces ingoldii]PWN93363.1 hypothetical protein FA10DRAFT_19698 [Acaromyces ingoldii]
MFWSLLKERWSGKEEARVSEADLGRIRRRFFHFRRQLVSFLASSFSLYPLALAPDRTDFSGLYHDSTTSTPPYNSESLQSYLIGGYSAGKEGTAYSEVASKLADSVTQIYPTLTVSYSDIVKQYVTALEASAADYHRDAAVSTTHSSSLGALAVVFAGVVAGGAFIL